MKLWTLLSQWYVGGDVSGNHIGAQCEEPVSGLGPDTRTSGRAIRGSSWHRLLFIAEDPCGDRGLVS